MFNSYSHRDGDTHVNVKQLPHDTADAARLYGEMVKKAETEVAGATVERLGANNEAALVRVDSLRSYATEQTTTRVLFKLNGQLYDVRNVEDSLARDKLRWAIANSIADLVYKKLCASSNGGASHD